MYSFAQRKDFSVVDEPFYASYLSNSTAQHPGKQAILDSQNQDFEMVMEHVINANYSTAHVLFKQMSHHLRNRDLANFTDAKNVILIRNPKDMIISFSKVINNPTIEDLGLKDSLYLLNYFNQHHTKPMVINSDELLENPKQYLEKMCRALKIPFDEEMLSWPKGPKVEDGVWAPHWYANVHQSIGFEKKSKKVSKLSSGQESLLKECLPYFNELNKYTI